MAELPSDGARPPALRKQGSTDSDRVSPNSPLLIDEIDPLTKTDLFTKLNKSTVSAEQLGRLEWAIFEKLLDKGKVNVRYKYEDTETEEPESTTSQTTTGIITPNVTRDSPQPSTSRPTNSGADGPTPSQMLFGIDTIFENIFEKSIDPQTNNCILSDDQKNKLAAIKTEDYRCKTLQMDVIKNFSPSSFTLDTKDTNLFRKTMRKPPETRERDGMAWMETYTETVQIKSELDRICTENWNDKANVDRLTYKCLTGVQTFIGKYQALVYNLIQKKEPEERHFQILFMQFLEDVVGLFPQGPYDSYHKKFIVPTMNFGTTGYTFAVPDLVLYETSLVPDSTGSMAYIEGAPESHAKYGLILQRQVKKKDAVFSDIPVRRSERIDHATPRLKLMCHLRDTVGAVLAQHYLELLGGAEDTVFKTLEMEENVPISYYTKLGIMQWNTKIKFVILKMPEKRFRTLVKQTQEDVNKYLDDLKKKEQKEREAKLEAIAKEDEENEDQKEREQSGGSLRTQEEHHEKRGRTRQSRKRTAKQGSKNEEGKVPKKKKISEGETNQEYVEVKSKSCLKKDGNKKPGMSQGEVTFEDDKPHKSKYNYPELWVSKSYSFLKHPERLEIVHSLLKFAHIAKVLRPNLKKFNDKEDD